MGLNPEYTIFQYPDAANEVSAEQYTKGIAEGYVKRARKVTEACRKRPSGP